MQEKNINFIYSENSPQRLDVYLSELTGSTRSNIQKSIKAGFLTVNSVIATKTGHKLEKNDQVVGKILLVPEPDEELKAENIELQIVFEDKDLIVVNKPAGLIVHPTTYLREGTLVNALLHKYQQDKLSNVNEDVFRPGIVHRLDRETSGLMVVAKSNEAHLHLAQQLIDRTLKRTYWAIAIGQFKEDTGIIEAPIGRHPSDRKKMAVIKDVQKKARYARTYWEVLEQFSKAALLKVNLDTGRTHQIRVHFEHIYHPLLGDPMYGGKRTETKLIKRQCLHAKEIQFIHPVSQGLVSFESELPADFKFVLSELKS